jgi:hypothetical protein
MTIPLLEVSFNNIFEYGQGYVALSRATCLEGLTLRSFQVSHSAMRVVNIVSAAVLRMWCVLLFPVFAAGSRRSVYARARR